MHGNARAHRLAGDRGCGRGRRSRRRATSASAGFGSSRPAKNCDAASPASSCQSGELGSSPPSSGRRARPRRRRRALAPDACSGLLAAAREQADERREGLPRAARRDRARPPSRLAADAPTAGCAPLARGDGLLGARRAPPRRRRGRDRDRACGTRRSRARARHGARRTGRARAASADASAAPSVAAGAKSAGDGVDRRDRGTRPAWSWRTGGRRESSTRMPQASRRIATRRASSRSGETSAAVRPGVSAACAQDERDGLGFVLGAVGASIRLTPASAARRRARSALCAMNACQRSVVRGRAHGLADEALRGASAGAIGAAPGSARTSARVRPSVSSSVFRPNCGCSGWSGAIVVPARVVEVRIERRAARWRRSAGPRRRASARRWPGSSR